MTKQKTKTNLFYRKQCIVLLSSAGTYLYPEFDGPQAKRRKFSKWESFPIHITFHYSTCTLSILLLICWFITFHVFIFLSYITLFSFPMFACIFLIFDILYLDIRIGMHYCLFTENYIVFVNMYLNFRNPCKPILSICDGLRFEKLMRNRAMSSHFWVKVGITFLCKFKNESKPQSEILLLIMS